MEGKGPLKVFLSSTSRDLADHRKIFIEQCHLYGYDVIAMEEFGAQDAGAVAVSLKEVGTCNLFVGVYAKRYGYVPSGYTRSVTELEYQEAVRLNMPRLAFVVDDDKPLYTLLDCNRDDDGENGDKLKAFLQTVGTERVWDRFTSPEDFARRALVGISKWEGWRKLEVPDPPDIFVGQAAFIDEAIKAIYEKQRVVLSGIGGIGKTASTQKIAQLTKDSFKGGIFWVNFGAEMHSLDTLLPSLMQKWASCHPLGRLVGPPQLNLFSIKRWLEESPGQQLFIFDDVWHAHPVKTLLRFIPENAHVLITTRLSDIAQQLQFAESLEVKRLSIDESLALLRSRLGSVPLSASLKRIAEILDGHPLALSIAIAQIEEKGSDYADRLPELLNTETHSHTVLRNLHLESDEYDKNIELVLKLTYSNLSADLKRRFRSIGVLTSGSHIPLDMLAAIWEKDEELAKPDEMEERAQALVGNGVLSRNEEINAYAIHRLLHVYARVLLDKEELPEAFSRYMNFTISKAEQIFRQSVEEWKNIDAYLPHIQFIGNSLYRAAEHWFSDLEHLAVPVFHGGFSPVSSDLQILEALSNANVLMSNPEALGLLHICLRFVRAVLPYIKINTSIGQTGLRWLWLGTAVGNIAGHNQIYGEYLGHLAEWYFERGDTERAMEYWNVSRRKFRFFGDKRGEALILVQRAMAYHETGHNESALNFLEKALWAAQEEKNIDNQIIVLCNISRVKSDCKAHGEAQAYVQQAEELLQGASSSQFQVEVLRVKSALQLIDNPAKALATAEQALSILGVQADPDKLAEIYTEIARIHQTLEAFETAERLLLTVVDIRTRQGLRAKEADALLALGALFTRKDTARAFSYLTNALTVYQEIADLQGEGNTLYQLGSLKLLAGETQEAAQYFLHAVDISHQTQSKRLRASLLTEANNHQELQEFQDVLAHITALEAVSQDVEPGYHYRHSDSYPNPFSGPDALRRYAFSATHSQDFETAITFDEQALQAYRESGDRERQALTLSDLGEFLGKTKQYDQAIERYSEASAIWKELGNQQRESATLYNLALIYVAVEKKKEALILFTQSLVLSQNIHDTYSCAAILTELAYLNRDLGHLDQSLRQFEEAAQAFLELGNTAKQAEMLRAIAFHHFSYTEDYVNAERFMDQALEIAKLAGNRRTIADSLADLGWFLGKKIKRPLQGLEKLKQALEIFEDLDQKDQRAETLFHIGDVYWDLGEFQAAIEAFEQSAPLYMAVENYAQVSKVYDQIGQLYKRLAQLEKTFEYYQRAINHSREHNLIQPEIFTLNQLAGWYWDTQNYVKAEETYRDGIAKARAAGFLRLQAISLGNLSTLYEEMAEPYKALAVLDELQPLIDEVEKEQRIPFREKLISYYLRFARMLEAVEQMRIMQQMALQEGDLHLARKWEASLRKVLPLAHLIQKETAQLNTELRVAQQGGHLSLQAVTHYRLGVFYVRLNLFDAALYALTQSAELLQKINDERSEIAVQRTMADIYEKQENWLSSFECHRRAAQLCAKEEIYEDQADVLFSLVRLCLSTPELQDNALPVLNEYIELAQLLHDGSRQAVGLLQKSLILDEANKSYEALLVAQEALSVMRKYGLDKDKGGYDLEQYEHSVAVLRAKQEDPPHDLQERLLQTILIWTAADDWKEARRLFETNKELLMMPFAYAIMDAMLDMLKEQKPELLPLFFAYRKVLRWAHEDGIESAINRISQQ